MNFIKCLANRRCTSFVAKNCCAATISVITSGQNTARRNMAQTFSGRSLLLFADFELSCQGRERGERARLCLTPSGRPCMIANYFLTTQARITTDDPPPLYYFFYNSRIPLPSRGLPTPWSPRGVSHKNIQYFLAPNPLTRNHISYSEKMR